MKKLVVIEVDNNITKERHGQISRFMEEFDGEIVKITDASNKTTEIVKELQTCTDFAFQTVFIDRSADLVEPLMRQLAKIKTPINIHIGAYEIEENLLRCLRYCNPKEEEFHFVNNPVDAIEQIFHSVKHHNFYEMGRSSLSAHGIIQTRKK